MKQGDEVPHRAWRCRNAGMKRRGAAWNDPFERTVPAHRRLTPMTERSRSVEKATATRTRDHRIPRPGVRRAYGGRPGGDASSSSRQGDRWQPDIGRRAKSSRADDAHAGGMRLFRRRSSLHVPWRPWSSRRTDRNRGGPSMEVTVHAPNSGIEIERSRFGSECPGRRLMTAGDLRRMSAG